METCRKANEYFTFSAHQLRECLTTIPHCRDSTVLVEMFHCHVKGKYPHPTNPNLYLRCPGPGYQACLCSCKYEEMCFDSSKRRCKFEFLGSHAHCTRPLPQSALSGVITPVDETEADVSNAWATQESEEALNIQHGLERETSKGEIDYDIAADESATPPHRPEGASQLDSAESEDVLENWARNTQALRPHHHTTASWSTESNPHRFPTWIFTLVLLCVAVLIIVLLLYACWLG